MGISSSERKSDCIYPIHEATLIAAETIRTWLDSRVRPEASSSPRNSSIVPCVQFESNIQIDRIILCVFSAKDEEVYNEIVPRFFPPTKDDIAAAQEQEDA